MVFMDQWRGADGPGDSVPGDSGDRPGRVSPRRATIEMQHAESLDWEYEVIHDGDQIWPLRPDGLPSWFPSEAPILRNSAVLAQFPDGTLHLRAMSNAGTRAVQLLAQWGYSLVVDSYADVTADTGVPITRYREIRCAEYVSPEEVAVLGRRLRLGGVVVHSYLGRFDQEGLRFRRTGGLSAFPELRVLHRTAFDAGCGRHYFGHPRQLRAFARLLGDTDCWHAGSDGQSDPGALAVTCPEIAQEAEATYQEELGGLVVADSYTFGQGPDAADEHPGTAEGRPAQRAA